MILPGIRAAQRIVRLYYAQSRRVGAPVREPLSKISRHDTNSGGGV
jgi:hypothetical protein